MRQTKKTRILVISLLALLLVPGMVFGQGQQGIVPMEGTNDAQPLSSDEDVSSDNAVEAESTAAYRVVEEISVSGELVLEENELPKIVDNGVTYRLHANYPYLLSLDLDIADGETVEVEGFELPEAFRWDDADEDEVVLRVSKAVIGDETYYLGMNIENGKLMVPENYAGMPGMAGMAGRSGKFGTTDDTWAPAMGMAGGMYRWNDDAAASAYGRSGMYGNTGRGMYAPKGTQNQYPSRNYQAAPQSEKGAYGYAQPGRNMNPAMNPAMNQGAWGAAGSRGAASSRSAAGAWGSDERPYIEDCPYFQDNPRFDDDSAYGRRFDDDGDDYENYGRRFDDDSAYGRQYNDDFDDSGARRNGRK